MLINEWQAKCLKTFGNTVLSNSFVRRNGKNKIIADVKKELKMEITLTKIEGIGCLKTCYIAEEVRKKKC